MAQTYSTFKTSWGHESSKTTERYIHDNYSINDAWKNLG